MERKNRRGSIGGREREAERWGEVRESKEEERKEEGR